MEKISTESSQDGSKNIKMAKYRLLTSDELKEFEKEFVDYLVINGITAGDWEKLKKNNEEEAARIVNLFSDVVFEKIMRSITHLLKIEPQRIFAFQCEEEKIHVVSIETKLPSYDFTKEEGLNRLRTDPPSDLYGFEASKGYQDSREAELFNMTEQGCSICDSTWYESLKKLVLES